MNITFDRLGGWPRPALTKRRKSSAVFEVGYLQIVEELEGEIAKIGGRNVRLEANLTARDIKKDGWPYAKAKPHTHPGIVISFDRVQNGKPVRLSFACDQYDSWEANLRGISLTLTALRAVARHGATESFEQYQGFAALPPSPAAATNDAYDPAAVLLKAAGVPATAHNIGRMKTEFAFRRDVFTKATLKAHPDTGGTHTGMLAVNAAWERLNQ